MRVVWRALLLLAVFAGAGYLAMHLLIAHAVARGTPEYDARMPGAMGGLFVGGGAAVLVAIGLLTRGKKPDSSHDGDRAE